MKKVITLRIIAIIILLAAPAALIKAQKRSLDEIRTDLEILKAETMYLLDSLKFEAQNNISEVQLKYSSEIETIQMEANSRIALLKLEFHSRINDLREKAISCHLMVRKYEKEMSALESEFETKLEEISICCSARIDKLEMEYENIAATIENNFRILTGRVEMDYYSKQKKLETELKSI
ncbi:MAG: hypothetical protein V2I37_12385 [Marinilabiliaceae bacterium]|jgi:hypothetical protein|nr:hypothetical protein [Marinilabiliaceae bacterium]